ncbi:MAG: hypothetical protein ACI3X6_05555 [Alloprevotella sp.]
MRRHSRVFRSYRGRFPMHSAGLAGGKQRAPAPLLFLNRRKAKLVNSVSLSAQGVDGAFAIVKAARRESLGIIKTTKICSGKKSMKIKEIFTFKHIVKTIKEQIFTLLLIIFTIL